MKNVKISIHLNKVHISGGNFNLNRMSDALSYKVPGCEFVNSYINKTWDGHFRFLKYGEFPRGLLSRFLSFCEKSGIKVKAKQVVRYNLGKYSQKKAEFHGFDNLSVQLRKYQKDAASAAYYKRRGLIQIPTGGGKTLIMVALVNHIVKPTLILVSKKESLHDISDILKKELLEDSVGIVGGGIYDPKIFDVGSVQFISRNLKSLKEYLNTKLLVMVDEAHHSSAKTWYNTINKCNFGTWKLGFTATPSRDPTSMLTEACLGPVVYNISSKQLIEQKFLSPPEIMMITINKIEHTGREKLSLRLDYGNTYSAGIESNDYRNEAIGVLCEYLVRKKEYPAIVTKTKEHIRHIVRVLTRKKIKHMVLTGDSPVKKRLEAYKEMRREFPRVIIFSTIFDEAIDIPALKAIIMAGSGKSFKRTIQQMGRGMRIYKDKKKVRIFDFFDTTHGYLERHSNERKRTYEREGYNVMVTSLVKIKNQYL